MENKKHPIYQHSNYNKKLKNTSRTLRKNMTPEEKHLWYDYLKKHEMKFYRQRAIDNYIADFYCPKIKLVIELDGSQHYTQEGRTYDDERTAVMKSHDISVIRFSNIDIFDHFESVCKAIDKAINERLDQLSIIGVVPFK